MIDRIILSLTFIPFIIWGLIGIFSPELSYKTTSIHTFKKKPTKFAIKRYKFSSYIMLIVGVILIILAISGGFEGT